MKSGISFPSVARGVEWFEQEAAHPDFPVSNLSNLEELRRVTRAAAPGNFSMAANFDGQHDVDFVALIHHNAPPGATVRVVLYATPDLIAPYAYDSGQIPVWPEGSADAGYPNVRPILLPAPVSAAGIYVALSNMGGVTCELGGVEVGRFWAWPDVLVPREIGIKSGATSVPMGSGVSHITRQWSPRTVSGSRDLASVSDVEEKLVDHHRTNGLHRTFVWCWDAEDPATWARQAMAVTNSDLPAGVREDYQSGRINFAFREQLR